MGPHILQPLKSQGVLAMEDSAMLVKAKFTAKPGEQFVIRREAYQRIKQAFDEGRHPVRPPPGHGLRAAGDDGARRVGGDRGECRRRGDRPERRVPRDALGGSERGDPLRFSSPEDSPRHGPVGQSRQSTRTNHSPLEGMVVTAS